uniref:Uncharacterized protein n=1 Tax=Arundo donax TaxID=35708 RepID=A0A0A9AAW5_ARUDO
MITDNPASPLSQFTKVCMKSGFQTQNFSRGPVKLIAPCAFIFLTSDPSI